MIKLSNITKVFQQGTRTIQALNNVSLHVPAGQIYGVIGASGAGKSTLIRCVNLLERPTEGSVQVGGQELTTLSESELTKARRQIGMIFQHFNLLSSRTVFGNVALPLELDNTPKEEIKRRVTELLDLVGLGDKHDSYPANLSGGQKQRVAIARALASNPKVLLCDEATSALDPATTRSILELLKDINRRLGLTILLITHEMDVVRKVCDSVTLLDHGRIVATGPVADVVTDVDSPLARMIVPAPDFSPLNRDGSIVDVSFTSHPGEPTGSRVMSLAAEYGADIGAGTFETLGSVQIARLALTIDPRKSSELVAGLKKIGASAEVRAA